MANPNHPPDILDFDGSRKKLPDTLNVLTILTFVGCAIGFIASLYGYTHAKEGYENLVRLQDNMENVPGFLKGMTGPQAVEIARLSLENKTPILLLSLVGYGLCIYGAIRMRAWKKEGFYIYLCGEILPLIGSFIFIGAGIFAGFSGIFGLAVPLFFILMYAAQLKHLS